MPTPALNVADRVSTDGGGDLRQNPFGSLESAGLAKGPSTPPKNRPPPKPAVRNRGRVDVLRETGGRGGKTVTVVEGFIGIGLAEKEDLARRMRVACGCGSTVKDGRIEVQGDQREVVFRILTEAGFRPVAAGG